MTRRDTIIELARTLRDVIDPDTSPNGRRGKQTSRSLEMSRLYRAGSYQALEDGLAFMLSHRRQYAVAGHPLGRLHWHFTQRYLHSTVKPLPARQSARGVQVLIRGHWEPAKPSTGLREPLGGITAFKDDHGRVVQQVRVETWHSDVRHDRVNLAVDWLDAHLPSRIHLPDWDRLSERAA